MVFPKSGSLLESRINTTLSPQISIKTGPTTVGAIQTLKIAQARELLIWEEIGTDGVIEIHPKNAAKIDLNVSRIVFDQLRLTEAFNRGFINLQAQRFPFDIQIVDLSASAEEGDGVVHTMHNCWFNTYSPTYVANNFIITEDATLKCERITTMRNGVSAVSGGLRGISFEFDSMERTTDVNGRVGRIDATESLAR